MKKLLALLLVLATLVPMALVTNAATPVDGVTVDPFYMINFDSMKANSYENVLDAPFFWTSENVDLRISWGTADISDLAKKVKERFDTQPVGTHYIKCVAAGPYFRHYTENYVYFDKGVAALKKWMVDFVTEYKRIGGKLDGFILDTEIVDMGSWYLHKDVAKDTLLYHKIVTDPRYQTELRPLLVERGFPFYENVTDYTPEIYTISHNVTGTKASEARAIWDKVMRNRLCEGLIQCITEPVLKEYPDAIVSDYQSADRASWYKFLGDGGDNSFGDLTISGGNTSKGGNASNHNIYHCRPGANFYKDSKGETAFQNPYSYYQAIYEKSAFNMTLWEINQLKNIYTSTENRKFNAWITSYNYGDKPLAYSPYTTECVYHLGMLNPEPFLGYIVANEVPDVYYYDRLDVVSEQLYALTEVAGFSDRKPIEIPVNWNDSYLLSGMYCNGRNLWRITPDNTQVTLENFKVEGTDPTFRVNGKTITFPGGKILEEAAISVVGSCGYWVETAKDVTPVITTDAARYAKYPSLNINFDNGKDGEFGYNSCTPAGAWEIKVNKKEGSAATIVANNGGKALSLLGDTTIKSVKLPANITTGDTYAKDQVWDITVTIPEGLSADAVINVLGYEGGKQKQEDGGFKIQGGKLYISIPGKENEDGDFPPEYKELMDIAPGTYIFRRVLNFNDAEKYLSSYYVFSTDGKQLKSARNLTVPTFESITSINYQTEKTDKAILLDDYRITITGKAADFELYDAKTGAYVKDMTAVRNASTAYRLSWLNATDTAETATIVAEIYEGTTLKETKTIKEVAMDPGCDGVETGIVKVEEGQSVKVYLQTSNNAPAPDLTPYFPEVSKDTEEKEGGLNIGLIIIIAAAVVAVAGVAVALVLTAKPKKKEEKVEETTETPEEPEEKAEEPEEKTEE